MGRLHYSKNARAVPWVGMESGDTAIRRWPRNLGILTCAARHVRTHPRRRFTPSVTWML